jgi:hypothetical protein
MKKAKRVKASQYFDGEYADLVKRLHTIKSDTGLSNESLAHAIGVGVYTVHRWLKSGLGKAHLSTVRVLRYFVDEYEFAKAEGNEQVMEFLRKRGCRL